MFIVTRLPVIISAKSEMPGDILEINVHGLAASVGCEFARQEFRGKQLVVVDD